MNEKLKNIIKLAADDVSKLRKPDVYRVMDAAENDCLLSEMAWFLIENRPDLIGEVNDCKTEIEQLNNNFYLVEAI